jgi:hypothetical protein
MSAATPLAVLDGDAIVPHVTTRLRTHSQSYPVPIGCDWTVHPTARDGEIIARGAHFIGISADVIRPSLPRTETHR